MVVPVRFVYRCGGLKNIVYLLIESFSVVTSLAANESSRYNSAFLFMANTHVKPGYVSYASSASYSQLLSYTWTLVLCTVCGVLRYMHNARVSESLVGFPESSTVRTERLCSRRAGV